MNFVLLICFSLSYNFPNSWEISYVKRRSAIRDVMKERQDVQKQFVVVIDAGSTGSRVFVYAWMIPTVGKLSLQITNKLFIRNSLVYKQKFKNKISFFCMYRYVHFTTNLFAHIKNFTIANLYFK